MRTKIMLSGLLVTGLLTISARADDKLTLKLRTKKGEEYKETMKEEWIAKRRMGDKLMVMTMKTESEGTLLVEEVDAAGVQTFKNITTVYRAKMGGPRPMEYDSSKPETANTPWAKQMEAGANVGKTVTAKMDADGKVKDIKGDAISQEGMTKVKDGFTKFTQWMPTHPIGIGDSWEYKMNMSGMTQVPVVVDMKCTLVSRKAGIALIKVDGATKKNGQMEGTLQATLSVDEKTGWPMGNDVDIKMTITDEALGKVETHNKINATYVKK